jgi:hypothetical protein
MASARTRHCQERLRQRAIPPLVENLLHEFGTSMRCGGAERLFFDKAARRRLQAHLGGARGLKTLEPWLNVFVVVGDNGKTVTAGHRQGRFFRL